MVRSNDWIQVDLMLGDRMSLDAWRPFLQIVGTTEEFPKYADMYKSSGFPLDDTFYTATLHWAVRFGGKDYNDIIALYGLIKNPGPEAHNIFMEGLLRCRRVREARKVFLDMVKRGEVVDQLVGRLLLSSLIDCKDIPSARKAYLALDKQNPGCFDLCGLFRVMKITSDFEWYIENVERCDTSTLRSALASPWARKEDTFDVNVFFKALRRWNVPPDRYIIKDLVERSSHLGVLKLYGLEWSDLERNIIMHFLSKIPRYEIVRKESCMMAERLVEFSLSDPSCLDAATELAITFLKKHRRFNFELCTMLVERLLFHGKSALASKVVLTMVSEAAATASSGTCNTLLQRLHQYNQVSLAKQFIEALEALKSPYYDASIRYGRDLFKLPQKSGKEPEQFASVELFITHLKTLVRGGKIKKARALLETYNPRQEDEKRLLAISKVELFCRVPGKEDMIASLLELESIYQGTTIAKLASYGLSILNPEEYEPEPFSSGGDHRFECIRVANAIFQSICLFHSYEAAIKVKAELFNRIPMDLTTAKIYLHLHVQNPYERKTIEELLDEVVKEMRIVAPDMDIYSLLMELAVARGTEATIDDINFILDRIFSFGGAPDTRIFGHLFKWIQANGNLQLAQNMLQLMESNKVLPTTVIYDTLVMKALEAGELALATKWIREAAESPQGLARCSMDIVENYYETFYRSHPIAESQEELDSLLAHGYDAPAGHLQAAMKAAIDAGQSRKARKYMQRLRHMKVPVEPVHYERLIDLCLMVGDVNAAHQVHESLRTAIISDPDLANQPNIPFSERLQAKLPALLEKNPEWFGSLVPPSDAQPVGLTLPLLHMAIRHEKRMNAAWCQQCMTNLVARWEDAQAVSILSTYMMTNKIAWPTDMAEQVCKQWSILRKK